MFINKIEGRIITLDHRVFVFSVRLFIKSKEVDDILYPIIIQLFRLTLAGLASDSQCKVSHT